MKKNGKYSKNRSGHNKGPHKRHEHSSPRKNDIKPKIRTEKVTRASLYGFHAVAEAWMNEARSIEALYATEQGLKSLESVLDAARHAGLSRPEPTLIDKHAIEKALPQGAVHQGVALVTPLIEEADVQDFIISSDSKPTILVILDQVTDPHNVGAILRSACVFGLDGLIMQRKHAPFLDGVLAKTACGAVEHVPVAYETNLSRCIESLQEAGFFVYGLDERGEDLAEMRDIPEKIALIMGAEGPGLRRLVKENCDSLLRLPTSGPISSLNVSNAAAVSFYALKSLRNIKI
ncbi:MAG: 23S rRNA (guanosine(2251)-2'-O)-methyltransferase RlmB [Bdellovibrionales bacterium]